MEELTRGVSSDSDPMNRRGLTLKVHAFHISSLYNILGWWNLVQLLYYLQHMCKTLSSSKPVISELPKLVASVSFTHPMGKPGKSIKGHDTKNIQNLILLSYWDNICTVSLSPGKDKNKASGVRFLGHKIVNKWDGIFKFGEISVWQV